MFHAIRHFPAYTSQVAKGGVVRDVVHLEVLALATSQSHTVLEVLVFRRGGIMDLLSASTFRGWTAEGDHLGSFSELPRFVEAKATAGICVAGSDD